MIREILISLYLFFHFILFNFFKLFPIKNKIVFLVSFKDNNLFTYRELINKKFTGEIVFLCSKNMYSVIKKSVNVPVFVIESGKIRDEIMASYHMATAKTILVDNYYGFLAVMKFKKGVECIQIWHAAGALKNFGFLDHSVHKRSKRAKKRFTRVYRNFHKVVVNSRAFARIFELAFNIREDQFLFFGYPRTDFFFDKKLHARMKRNFLKRYPQFKDKKIILYAPTYRPEPKKNRLPLNIPLLYEHLHDEYVLFIRMHPSVELSEHKWQEFADFVIDFSRKATINELLVVSDLLITDYSSIPFEYTLLKKPMIFYPYDLEEYQENPGIWDKYENIVPGPLAYNTEDIIWIIKNQVFDRKKYAEFHRTWNEYSDGHSSEKLVDYILKRHDY